MSIVTTACANRACPTFGVQVSVAPSVQRCIVCLEPLPRVDASGHAEDRRPIRRLVAGHSRRPAVVIGAAIAVVLVGGLYAIGRSLGPSGGSAPGTDDLVVQGAVNNKVSTTVIWCDNTSKTAAAISVALLDGTGAAAGHRDTTLAAGGIVSFATYPVPYSRPDVIDATKFSGGSAKITASKGVDCTAVLMSKSYPPVMQGSLATTRTRPPRAG